MTQTQNPNCDGSRCYLYRACFDYEIVARRVLYRTDEVRRVVYLARIYHKGDMPDVTAAELDRANREVRSLEEQEEFRVKLKGRRDDA